MIVGICNIELSMHENHSLKEKRHSVKSIIEKIKHRYNVSIAEVGMMDKWQKAEIGFTTVSNNKRHVDETMQKVLNFIEQDGRFDLVVQQYEIF